MVPSAYVFLDRLPLTANGKVDRQALPEPRCETPFVEPQDDIERSLAAIFASVLGVVRVGRDDNFFDLGGHSLLATQIIARVRRDLHVELTVRHMFDVSSATVAGLANVIRALRWASDGEDDSRLVLQGDREEGEL